ncbi:MAG: DNA polymerase IV [Candidatus Firestonebacteria bacterium]
MADRVILHIDMNSFFASVEQASNPFLKGKPIVVAGDADPANNYARTIVTTSSYEARAFGVKTGMTIPEAKRLCPKVLVVTADPEKYIDASLSIHNILLRFTDLVEIYSIDECFMDITQFKEPPENISARIKKFIKDELNLTCSIGIGTNKLIAKLASDMKKPDGLTIIWDEEIPALFEKLEAKELWGIGEKTAEHLMRFGIKTAKQLGEASEYLLKAEFGINGIKLKQMGQGKYESRVRSYYEERVVKSVGHSHTLPKDTSDITVIKGFIRLLCEKTSKRMQKYGLKGRTVHFYVRWEDFTGFGQQVSVPQHTNSGLEIFRLAEGVFDKIILQKKVRLVGVSVSQLTDENEQGFLLEELEKNRQLKKAMYSINSKFGGLFVKPASVLVAENFGVRERAGMIGTYLFDNKNPK